MTHLDLFLHALSRFRAAVPAALKEEWYSRHGYDLALALHGSFYAITQSEKVEFIVFFDKPTNVVLHIGLIISDCCLDFFGSSADQRVADSIFEPDIEIAQLTVATADLLREALNQRDYFSTYWDAPPDFQTRLISDILGAVKDFA